MLLVLITTLLHPARGQSGNAIDYEAARTAIINSAGRAGEAERILILNRRISDAEALLFDYEAEAAHQAAGRIFAECARSLEARTCSRIAEYLRQTRMAWGSDVQTHDLLIEALVRAPAHARAPELVTRELVDALDVGTTSMVLFQVLLERGGEEPIEVLTTLARKNSGWKRQSAMGALAHCGTRGPQALVELMKDLGRKERGEALRVFGEELDSLQTHGRLGARPAPTAIVSLKARHYEELLDLFEDCDVSQRKALCRVLGYTVGPAPADTERRIEERLLALGDDVDATVRLVAHKALLSRYGRSDRFLRDHRYHFDRWPAWTLSRLREAQPAWIEGTAELLRKALRRESRTVRREAVATTDALVRDRRLVVELLAPVVKKDETYVTNAMRVIVECTDESDPARELVRAAIRGAYGPRAQCDALKAYSRVVAARSKTNGPFREWLGKPHPEVPHLVAHAIAGARIRLKVRRDEAVAFCRAEVQAADGARWHSAVEHLAEAGVLSESEAVGTLILNRAEEKEVLERLWRLGVEGPLLRRVTEKRVLSIIYPSERERLAQHLARGRVTAGQEKMLLGLLSSDDWRVRAWAVYLLGSLPAQSSESAAALRAAERADDPEVRFARARTR